MDDQDALDMELDSLRDELDEARAALGPIRNPSKRRPDMPMRFNHADKIEQHLQEDGHRVWGLVIYRCTYESDDEWDQFMERLRATINKSLEFWNGLDMLDSLRLTVLEDRAFNGVSTSVIRQKFRPWVETAPLEEQGTGPAYSQRYRYCIMVDEAALRSVLDNADDYKGFVNVVYAAWDSIRDCEHDDEEEEEHIEGCTLRDVGWMTCFRQVMVATYDNLRDLNSWSLEYRRPPEILIN